MTRRKQIVALVLLVAMASIGLTIVAKLAGAATTTTATPAYDSTWHEVGMDDFATSGVSSDWNIYNDPTAASSVDRWKSADVASDASSDGPVDITTSGDVGGGMAWRYHQPESLYGRWEVRAKATAASVAGSGPAILLWPTNHLWPEDGEIDLAESFDAARQTITNTLHYGANNVKLYHKNAVDFTQWQTLAVDWEPDSLTYYIDGAAVYSITNPSEIPHTPMFLALQENPYTATAPASTSSLEVDWVKVFAPAASAAGAAAPTVTSLSPASGTTAGGTSVKIYGTNLANATVVKFGADEATSFSDVSKNEIVAVAPTQTAAEQDISVTTAGGGTSAQAASDAFRYAAPVPAVAAISPTSGSTVGGTTVTLTGHGFTGASAVTFGTVAATRFTVVSDTEITAVTPSQAAAAHHISVTTAGGTGSGSGFTYVAPVPRVTVLSLARGSTAGDTETKITGTGLIGASRVRFGTLPATSYKVVSDTEITAYAPAQAAGTYDISVTTAGGTSAAVDDDQFHYVAPVPAVARISPTSGPTGGGTVVTFAGHGFTGATNVRFGNVAATSYTVVSDTEIKAVAPAQAAGVHNVYVTTAGGTGNPSSAYRFAYVATFPSVSGLSLAKGTTAGGTETKIVGTGFSGVTGIRFGDLAVKSATVVSSTEILAFSPAQAAGTCRITVYTTGGTSAAAAGDEFTYVAPVPVVAAISPTSGPTAGGTTVTFAGHGFTGATAVTFGRVAAASFAVLSDTEIVAVAPAEAAAVHNVSVTTAGGTGAPSSAYRYTYVSG